jgi:histone deacetylase 6
MSLHRHDHGQFYPGTGGAAEVGFGDGEGFTVNVPWDAADMANGDYLCAFNQVLIPIIYEYNPDLIIVSAGFDAADGPQGIGGPQGISGSAA